MPPSRQREREMERLRRVRQAQRRAEARRRARRRNAIIGSVVGVVLVLGAITLVVLSFRGGKKPGKALATPPVSTPTAGFPALPPGADPRLATAPVVSLPKTAPQKLGVTDLIAGRGAVARAGSKLTVNYVGVGFPAGKEFDSSWKGKTPYSFALGQGKVIRGWDQGLVGMRVGGRRQLAIPAALAYGTAGSSPTIKPNEPLVFVVDLLAAT